MKRLLLLVLLSAGLLSNCKKETETTPTPDPKPTDTTNKPVVEVPPIKKLAFPDDPYFFERWYLLNRGQTIGGSVVGKPFVDIRALEAWEKTKGDGIVVAVIDNGIAKDHPNFRGKLVEGYDFIEDDSDPQDERYKSALTETAELFHGTAVADAVLSIAPNAKIMPLRAMGFGIHDGDVAEAVDYAKAHGADIVVMSFGSFVPGFGYPLLAEAIKNAPNILFVAGAGNWGQDADITGTEPCTLPYSNIICVACTDENDNLGVFDEGQTNYGKKTVHLGAPGTNFLAAQPPLEVLRLNGNIWDFSIKNGPWAYQKEIGPNKEDGLVFTMNETFEDADVYMMDTHGLDDGVGIFLEFDYWSDIETGFLIRPITSSDKDYWIQRLGIYGWAEVSTTDGKWKHVYVPLQKEERYIGFRVTNTYGEAPGQIKIANFKVTANSSNYNEGGSFYAYVEGTSFSTPLTAGVAALVKAANPSYSPEKIKTAIMLGGEIVPELRDKTIAGTRLSALGALQMTELTNNKPSPKVASMSGLHNAYYAYESPTQALPWQINFADQAGSILKNLFLPKPYVKPTNEFSYADIRIMEELMFRIQAQIDALLNINSGPGAPPENDPGRLPKAIFTPEVIQKIINVCILVQEQFIHGQPIVCYFDVGTDDTGKINLVVTPITSTTVVRKLPYNPSDCTPLRIKERVMKGEDLEVVLEGCLSFKSVLYGKKNPPPCPLPCFEAYPR